MEYEIGRCTAPCVDLISKEDYMEDVDQVVMLLKGRSRDLERVIEKRMREASRARSYELAARFNKRFRATKVHRSTILRAMHDLGFSFKKKSIRPST